MFSMDNSNTIVMSAGDHFSIPLFIDIGANDSPMRYKLRAADKVCFVIGEANQDFNHALVRKVFTKKDLNKYGDVKVTLSPTDTKYVSRGQYYYMIKIKLANGNIETIIPKRKFVII